MRVGTGGPSDRVGTSVRVGILLLGTGTGILPSSTVIVGASRAGLSATRGGSVRSARLMSSSSSSSRGAGDVGEGISVGTGISVGEEGAVGLVRRVEDACAPDAPVLRLGTAIKAESVGTSVGTVARRRGGGTRCIEEGGSVADGEDGAGLLRGGTSPTSTSIKLWLGI